MWYVPSSILIYKPFVDPTQRVDPNLLHWQRADAASAPLGTRPASRPPSVFPGFSSHPASRTGSLTNIHAQPPAPIPRIEEPATRSREHDPRPPSYVSEDGVSYVVEAAPRSVAPSTTAMSDVHPAWRPGFAF